MAEPLADRQQKKIIRTLTRLKHSLAADEELEKLLEQRLLVGSQGVVPQIESSLSELLGGE